MANDLRTRIADALTINGITSKATGCGPHSWRCEYPERYGSCDCYGSLIDDIEATIRDYLDTQRITP